MRNKIYALLVLLAVQVLMLSNANAAFCSLRDPVAAIQILYGEEHQYRSLVATVTEEDRLAVKAQLPFTIHQSEVGRHTLYVIYKGEQHVGFLQARSEWAKWGLIEIAWAINADRSLKGFYFQRCRSPQCNDTVVQDINQQLQNKTLEELKMLLSDDGKSFSAAGELAFTKAPSLALLALHSALKTLVITDISWEKEIANIVNEAN